MRIEIEIIHFDPDSPEGIALHELLQKEMRELRAKVRKHAKGGPVSFEGMCVDDDGVPRMLDADD